LGRWWEIEFFINFLCLKHTVTVRLYHYCPTGGNHSHPQYQTPLYWAYYTAMYWSIKPFVLVIVRLFSFITLFSSCCWLIVKNCHLLAWSDHWSWPITASFSENTKYVQVSSTHAGFCGACFPLFPVFSTPSWLEADGRPSWFWFWWRSLPVKMEFFLPTITLCTLRTGDWIEEKFQCNLLVSLARQFFLIGSIWIALIWSLNNYDCITMNWTVSLKCLEMTFLVIKPFKSKTVMNWTELSSISLGL